VRIQNTPKCLKSLEDTTGLEFSRNSHGTMMRAQEFAHSLTPHRKIHAIILIIGLTIDLTPEIITRVTTLPLGIPWRKEDKEDN